MLNRRQFLAAAAGAVGAAATGSLLAGHVWPLLTKEDLIPGTAPDMTLEPKAWPDSLDRLRFAAAGRQRQRRAPGHGGRRTHGETYRTHPFEFVALLGDICYYGNFEDRFDDVFRRPMGPLHRRRRRFELALGNHDAALDHSDDGSRRSKQSFGLLGTPSRYYTTTHRPS